MKKTLLISVLAIAALSGFAQTRQPEGESVLVCPDSHHPHLIDLGLPSDIKWACCNIGAKAPEEHGNYYQWGETEPEEEYTGASYLYYYQDIGSNIQGTDYDVAHVKWQGGWLMPNREQVDEMVANCTFENTTLNDVLGRLYTGANGNRIFLPYTGWAKDGSVHESELVGVYWTSEVYDGRDAVYYAYDSNTWHPDGRTRNWARFDGLVVRAIHGSDLSSITKLLVTVDNHDTGYTSLDGRHFNGKPTQKGVYIVNGKKIIVK